MVTFHFYEVYLEICNQITNIDFLALLNIICTIYEYINVFSSSISNNFKIFNQVTLIKQQYFKSTYEY